MAVGIRSWTAALALALVFVCLFTLTAAVKEEGFKTCDQSGFCKRQRAFADYVTSEGTSYKSLYTLDPTTILFKNGVFHSAIRKKVDSSEGTIPLTLTIAFLQNGAARVTFDEYNRAQRLVNFKDNNVKIRKERYNGVGSWVLVGGLSTDKSTGALPEVPEGRTRITWGEGDKHEVEITHHPLTLDFKRNGETHIKLNERNFLNIEHWRQKPEDAATPKPEPTTDPDADDEDEKPKETPEPKKEDGKHAAFDESTWWEESFGGNTDSKPRGPESVGVDVTFVGYDHVYGIPEHTGPMSLKTTKGGSGNFDQPYRLYNLDVFEYIMDSPMALYGAIPYMQAHRKDSSVGVFFMNAAEMWIDIVKDKSLPNPLSLGTGDTTDTKTHWYSESGMLDMFVLLGPTPKENSEIYGQLTGYTKLPPLFSIAYHQCRWNYITDEDVKDVDRKFDKFEIPYDVIWLDIEYTDGKKYFTWDPLTFANPVSMQQQLAQHERKLVGIIDPHIKNEADYFVIDELKDRSLAVKNKEGNQFEGWCWPGNSMWVDCFSPNAIKWWKSLFDYKKFVGSTSNMHIWNDMNEPSVFSGPETTMPKDNIHYGDWEHRDVHNLNGMTFVNATYSAIIERDNPSNKLARQRPFVLTRAFFAGSQRLGAMWTGDNLADWDHLAASLPMVLNNGISGFPFAGADIGGFFGNPSKELLTRWYQVGSFYPFMRGHAHIDTRRREPYLIGEPYTPIITKALRLRYSLLPTWYTAFHKASTHGHPIVKPNWWLFPSDEKGFGLDDQMYLGDSGLLVKPVTKEGGKSVEVYISDAVAYYDYFDYTIYSGSAGRHHKISAPLEKLPLLMQSGKIFPRRDRPRRSSGLMKNDPYTLVVVLDQKLGTEEGVKAEGEIYIDDGETFRYTDGSFIHRYFKFMIDAEGKMKLFSEEASAPGSKTAQYAKAKSKLVVEKVIIVGAPDKLKDVTSVAISEEGKGSSGGSRTAELVFEPAKGGKAAYAVVKKPDVSVGGGWKIEI